MSLTRRTLLQSSLAVAAASPLLSQHLWGADISSLYRDSIIIDGLGFPGSLGSGDSNQLSARELADVAATGLTATHLTVGDVGTMPPLQAFEAIVRSVTRWESEVDRHPEVLASIRSAADIEAAKTAGVTGLVYGLQDGVAFEDDLGRLDALSQLGVRIVQPTYNRRNLLGDGCMEPSDAGLSRAGADAVHHIHELRLLLDLSHCGRRTTADAIALAGGPVSFTHTGCHALAEHPRHRTDEELRAAAESGGIVGIYVMPYLARGRQPTAADVIDHMEHALRVVGEDHVSVGTDGTISPVDLTDAYREQFRRSTRRRKELGIAAPFETEEGYLFASDLNTPRRFETLGEMLLARGHSHTRVVKLLGGNLLRVYRDIWGS